MKIIMEQSKSPKPLGVRIIIWLAAACLPVVLVLAGLILYSNWNKIGGRSRNTAAQAMLQQMALAQVAHQTDTGRYAADWTGLAQYGFRPDPNVRMLMMIIDLDWGAGRLSGFVAKANHAAKREVYIYDNIDGNGVQLARQVKPLGDEYAVTVVSGGDQTGGEPMRLSGPPFLKVSLPELANRSEMIK